MSRKVDEWNFSRRHIIAEYRPWSRHLEESVRRRPYQRGTAGAQGKLVAPNMYRIGNRGRLTLENADRECFPVFPVALDHTRSRHGYTIPVRQRRGWSEAAGEEALTNGFGFANPTLAAPQLEHHLFVYCHFFVPC